MTWRTSTIRVRSHEKTPDSNACDGYSASTTSIIVWWQHLRYVYCNAIEDQAWQEAGPGPHDNWLTEGATKNYSKVGRSRKKLVSYTCREPSPAQRQHYDLLRDIEIEGVVQGLSRSASGTQISQPLQGGTSVAREKYGNAVYFFKCVPFQKLRFFKNMLTKYGQNLNAQNSSNGSPPTLLRVMSYLAPMAVARCAGHAKVWASVAAIYFNEVEGRIWLLIVYAKAKFDNLPAEFLAQLKREVENG